VLPTAVFHLPQSFPIEAGIALDVVGWREMQLFCPGNTGGFLLLISKCGECDTSLHPITTKPTPTHQSPLGTGRSKKFYLLVGQECN
jgi:hypothetical protein